METITYAYEKGLNWIEVVAEAMEGSIDGNFIISNNGIFKGRHCVIQVEEGITAMLIDGTYKKDLILEIRNKVDHFIGMYFYLTSDVANLISNNNYESLGKFDFNISIVGSELDLDYIINKDTSSYTVCLFVHKTVFKSYLDKISRFDKVVSDIFDTKKNSIVSVDRMSTESLILMNNFKKTPYDSPLFQFQFNAFIYELLFNYLNQLHNKKIVISKVIGDDFKNIIISKALLLERIEEVFPGVDFLAEKAMMSPSKYKKLFTKIVGASSGTFFHNSKLLRAKELLESGQYTIGEVAQKLNYSNTSYFAKRFNETYGVFPKKYQSLL